MPKVEKCLVGRCLGHWREHVNKNVSEESKRFKKLTLFCLKHDEAKVNMASHSYLNGFISIHMLVMLSNLVKEASFYEDLFIFNLCD